MTIRTVEVPGAEALKSVAAKIRKYCDCGADPDGYFTYTEDKKISQYFFGEGDRKLLKGFFTPETGCRNHQEETNRRLFWWHTIESELFAGFELTAPITFWAADECSKWFTRVQDPVWDLSTYGHVSVGEFLESLTISGEATFNYRQLAAYWHEPILCKKPLSDIMIPWIEQLPYADIFICNKDLYAQACHYGG